MMCFWFTINPTNDRTPNEREVIFCFRVLRFGSMEILAPFVNIFYFEIHSPKEKKNKAIWRDFIFSL